MATPRFQIVLARLVEDPRVVELRRADLGESPVMETFLKPVAMMWKNRGSEADVTKARAYAEREGYRVFVYQKKRDPLGQAKADIQAS